MGTGQTSKFSFMINIQIERVGRMVLVGDLAGFSNCYASGDPAVVEEFIRRFYVACSVVISAAGGELVKYTGDGFLSVWPLEKDFKANSQAALVLDAAAIALSFFVKFAELDLKLDLPIHLQQGITIEPNAVRVSFDRPQGFREKDYIGKMINLAFRSASLPKSFPYVAAHKSYVDIVAMDGSSYHKEEYRTRQVTADEIKTLFKGVALETEAIVTNEYWREDSPSDA